MSKPQRTSAPPPSNLPRLSEPWARWATGGAIDNQSAIDRVASDSSSAGSILGARMDNIAFETQRIAEPLLINIPISNYSATVASTPIGDASSGMAVSGSVTFVSPRAGVAKIAVNAHIKNSNIGIPSGWMVVRVNGKNYGGLAGSRLVAGDRPPGVDSVTTSEAVTVRLPMGASTLQIAIAAGNGATITVSNINASALVFQEMN